MSGYFARLAAQLNVPPAANGVPTPSAIEQHVEVEAVAPAVGAADVPAVAASAQALPQRAWVPQASPRPLSARSRFQSAASGPVQRAADAFESMRTAAPLGANVESIPVTTMQRKAAARERTLAALKPVPATSPTLRPHQSAEQTLAWLQNATTEPLTPELPLLVQADRMPAHNAAGIGSARAIAASRPQRSVPTHLDSPPSAARSPASAAAEAASAPRTVIRIGTIALEVRTPPPASPPPAAMPVATPASAPSRFSLHRHYLRWS